MKIIKEKKNIYIYLYSHKKQESFVHFVKEKRKKKFYVCEKKIILGKTKKIELKKNIKAVKINFQWEF